MLGFILLILEGSHYYQNQVLILQQFPYSAGTNKGLCQLPYKCYIVNPLSQELKLNTVNVWHRYKFKFQNSYLKNIANLIVIYIQSSSSIHEDENQVRASQSAFSPRLLSYAYECKILTSPFLLSKMPFRKLQDKQNEISYIKEFHTNVHSGRQVVSYAT